MKNKKLIVAVIALVAVVAVMLGIWFATRPEPTDPTGSTTQSGESNAPAKTFTVEVVHGDGSVKTFTYETDEDYLGAVLYAEGLIVADEANSGMFHTVDGEKADWNENQSYWALYIGEEYAMTGVDQTPVNNGDSFRLVYTIG